MLDFIERWYMGTDGSESVATTSSEGNRLISEADGACHKLTTGNGEWVACWSAASEDSTIMIRKERHNMLEFVQYVVGLVIDVALIDGGSKIVRRCSAANHPPCGRDCSKCPCRK